MEVGTITGKRNSTAAFITVVGSVLISNANINTVVQSSECLLLWCKTAKCAHECCSDSQESL